MNRAKLERPMLFGIFERVSPKELAYVVLSFIVVNFFTGFTQPRIKVHGGMGWDGEVFVKIAQQIVAGQRPAETAPFVFQSGTPLLVALFHPADLVSGFLWVNIAAGLAIVLLLALWLGLWIKDWKLRLILNFSFQTTWAGPICFVWFYPVLTDHWPTVFILASLLWMKLDPSLWRASLGVSALCFVGIFFREVLFAVPLSFLLIGSRWDRLWRSLFDKIWVKLLPLLAILAGWLALHLWVIDLNTLHWSYWNEAWELMRAHSVFRWCLAWLSAFGPILFAVLLRPRKVLSFFKEQPALALFFGAVAFLTFVSSSEERYFFWLSPIVYLIVGLALETEGNLFRHWGMGAFLLAAQAISQRLFWITPPQWPFRTEATPGLPVLLTPLGPHVNYFDLISIAEKPDVAKARLLQYACLGLFFVLAQGWKDRDWLLAMGGQAGHSKKRTRPKRS